MPPRTTEKGAYMFELKKYKVVKTFNGYPEGITVAFNGSDALKYKDFIVAKENIVAPVVVEEKKTRKYVRKGKK